MIPKPNTVPAYGRAVIDARRRGEPVNLFVYCGSRCWDMAQLRQHGVAVPTPDDANRIDWRPIAGGLPGVTLIARGWEPGAVETLARVLILAGAKLVASIRVDSTGECPRIEHEFYRRMVRK
jgi:hypothetical protein